MNNYDHNILWDVIIHPRHNSLAKSPLKLENDWVITSHSFIKLKLIIHCYLNADFQNHLVKQDLKM